MSWWEEPVGVGVARAPAPFALFAASVCSYVPRAPRQKVVRMAIDGHEVICAAEVERPITDVHDGAGPQVG
jgi:hypothetical protein